MKGSTVFKTEDLLFFHLFCPLFCKMQKRFLKFCEKINGKSPGVL